MWKWRSPTQHPWTLLLGNRNSALADTRCVATPLRWGTLATASSALHLDGDRDGTGKTGGVPSAAFSLTFTVLFAQTNVSTMTAGGTSVSVLCGSVKAGHGRPTRTAAKAAVQPHFHAGKSPAKVSLKTILWFWLLKLQKLRYDESGKVWAECTNANNSWNYDFFWGELNRTAG